MKQNYEEYDAEEHMKWLVKAFEDQRYIRVNSKPIFLIYKPNEIPDIRNVINSWRNVARNKFGIELYLCAVKSWGNFSMRDEKAIDVGFDAIVDFQPNMSLASKDIILNRLKNFPGKAWNRIVNKLGIYWVGLANDCNTIDYESIVKKWIKNPPVVKEFPCVAPSWDNSSRKKVCTIAQNNNPDLYGVWLEAACKRVMEYEDDEQLVFINAWNEWGKDVIWNQI